MLAQSFLISIKKCCCAWQANAAKQQQAAAHKLSKQHPVAAEASARLPSKEAEDIGQAQVSAPEGKAGARAGRKRGRDTGSVALDKPARKRHPPPRYSACCPTTTPPPLPLQPLPHCSYVKTLFSYQTAGHQCVFPSSGSCISGTCSCQFPSVYSASMLKCHIFAGAPAA